MARGSARHPGLPVFHTQKARSRITFRLNGVVRRAMRRASVGIVGVMLLAGCAGQRATTATTTPAASPQSPSASPIAVIPSPSPPPQRVETSLPVALEESAAAVAGGKLYVIGGFDAAGNSLSTA